MENKEYVYNKVVKKNTYTLKKKINFNYTWCMVFVMILIKINSGETSAIFCD